jgi:hypothetical protein
MEYHLTEGRTLDALRAAADNIGFAVIHQRPQGARFGIAWLENATSA